MKRCFPITLSELNELKNTSKTQDHNCETQSNLKLPQLRKLDKKKSQNIEKKFENKIKTKTKN